MTFCWKRAPAPEIGRRSHPCLPDRSGIQGRKCGRGQPIRALDDAAVVKEDTGSYVFIRLFGYVLDAMEDFAVVLEVSNGLLAV